MSVVLLTGIVKEVSLVDDLIDLFSNDLDLNGHNGVDFINKNALEAGYPSDAEYYANKFVAEGGEISVMVGKTIDIIAGSVGCSDYHMNTHSIDGGLYVAVAYEY